jgi:hypothetical protein
MSMLVIFYWVLLLLVAIGAFAPIQWAYLPRANSVVMLILFIIIGSKILKPTW